MTIQIIDRILTLLAIFLMAERDVEESTPGTLNHIALVERRDDYGRRFDQARAGEEE